MKKEDEFKCFFCNQPADRIAFYSKFYPDGQDTIEDPVLSCPQCYLSEPMVRRIRQVRGGGEGISCILFKTFGAMNERRIGYYLSPKFFGINHFNSPFWKKLIWRLHYTHLVPIDHAYDDAIAITGEKNIDYDSMKL